MSVYSSNIYNFSVYNLGIYGRNLTEAEPVKVALHSLEFASVIVATVFGGDNSSLEFEAANVATYAIANTIEYSANSVAWISYQKRSQIGYDDSAPIAMNG